MKKNQKCFVAGFLCGAVIFGMSSAYAAGVLAVPTAQSIYIDGQKADITGYNIEGQNYFQLRALGKQLDIAVEYDEKTNRVFIGEQPHESNKTGQRAETLSEPERAAVDVSVRYDSNGRPLLYSLKPGDVIYGTGNVSREVNPYAAEEYDGYMTIKAYSEGVPFPSEPLTAVNPLWDKSYYEIEMPNPVPCYTHILAGQPSEFMGMEIEGGKEQYDMYVFNAHETQRIIDELYNTFLEHPECYTDGTLNCTVRVGLPASAFEGNFFYPYRDSCVEMLVYGRNIEYMVYAVDIYTDGVYMGTRYICADNCKPDNPDVISTDTAIMKDRQNR